MRKTTECKGWSLAWLIGVTGAWLVAQPAAAQPPCLEPDDAAEETLEFLIERLDFNFGVDLNDADLCEALAENFSKTCSAAVKESVKCLQIQIAAWSRLEQIGCKALLTGDAAKACSTNAKSFLKGYQEQYKNVSGQIISDCESSLATEYFEICMFGF